MSKIIVVIGATGNQGGSVATTFLGLPGWTVRAVTRNPESAKAKALAEAGAIVIKADLADAESLHGPFANATAIFLNTDFWETYRPAAAKLIAAGQDPAAAGRLAFDYETRCRKNVADVAATIPTLERLVVSSLTSLVPEGSLDPSKFTRSFHPEAKNWGVEYIETQLPQLARKMSVIVLCAYNTNRLLVPQKSADGRGYQFLSPLKPGIHIATIDPTTGTGPYVRALVEDEAAGVKLMAYDSNQTLEDVVDVFRRVMTGHAETAATQVVRVTPEQMIQAGAMWEVLEGVAYINEHDAYKNGVPGYIKPEQLKKKVQRPSFEDWAKTVDWEKLISDQA